MAGKEEREMKWFFETLPCGWISHKVRMASSRISSSQQAGCLEVAGGGTSLASETKPNRIAEEVATTAAALTFLLFVQSENEEHASREAEAGMK